ncbi:MAG: 50S ribosomal protein L4 [Candidatus Staskawiczbacteria bacterium RIFCSPLOWO2_01_FULL_33_9]|uniref:Large ribosomal subunit protein uL4 n=1 Tax=Candidatus Staskawiczbacteria bacterium RIFCSPLOWO2_01_FULL_33_9 TaxID=1802211 RepID=A0A1G2I9U6_9BACT|nr:MAG: 50S ribosomal protein L4 [Candidatus Staskawiczbacteria bacterium RIFCSPLOWO2_01_FULL_33_9]
MKTAVYNKEGKKVEEISLPKEIFDVKLNTDLLHQIVVSQMANKRQITAHTKDRSEVRGGGKKPWRQKGTGRSRHGSIRSPLWRGGGITFGPRKERVFEKDVPKKMRRKALLMVLSEKAKGNFLVILDEIKIDKPKTKDIANTLNKLPCKENSCLIALQGYDKKIFLSARNIKKTAIVEARNLNVVDLMTFKYLLMERDTIKILEKTFLK